MRAHWMVAACGVTLAGCFVDPQVIRGETDDAADASATRGRDTSDTSMVTTMAMTEADASESASTSGDSATGPSSDETGAEGTAGTGSDPTVCPAQGGRLPPPPVACDGTGDDAPGAVNASCWPGDPAGLEYSFVASVAGSYTITTFDEAPTTDTALAVLRGGTEISCNRDIGSFPNAPPFYLTSSVSVDLAAGESVTIVVAFETGPGPFRLRVEQPEVPGGDCCVPHGLFSGGCSAASVSACTCELDEFCCALQWDATCVDLGVAACDAQC